MKLRYYENLGSRFGISFAIHKVKMNLFYQNRVKAHADKLDEEMKNLRILLLVICLVGLLIINEYFVPQMLSYVNKADSGEKTKAISIIMPQQQVESQNRVGWNAKEQPRRMLNTKPIERIRCEVFSVDTVSIQKNMPKVLHLMVETDDELIPVYLGPLWVFEERFFKIEPNDKVRISGFRLDIEGVEMMVASEVEKNKRILRLRNQKGLPIWTEMSGFARY